MIDLTGANLVNYLLRMIRDIVERNPRWKNNLGEVTFPANTIIRWGDVWCSVTSVTTSGTRLSPSYFMCTQIGRAILAKVGDKDGQFIEWTREVDPTHMTPTAGVYYLNVDFFDDRTRELGLTVQKFRWAEGKLKQAIGTVVNFRPGIDLNTVRFFDSSTSLPVQVTPFNQSIGGFAYLISPCQQLNCQYSSGVEFPAWYFGSTYGISATVTFEGTAYISQAPSTGVMPGTDPAIWVPYS